jgi:hypothetical protein
VGQATTRYRLGNFDETIRVGLLAVIKSKHLLVEIVKRMIRFNRDIGASQAAFEQRPEVFDTVRVNATLCVLFGMVDHVMCVLWIEARVAKQRICEHFGASFDLGDVLKIVEI